MTKSPDAFRTISEVAEWLDVPTHVLRFWESRFVQVKPVKRAGGRRYYRPTDMELLGGIRRLLHEDGLTIRGVQKILREEGVRHVAALSHPLGGTRGDAETGSPTPMAVDVPTLPETGEILPFDAEARSAARPRAAEDAALERWPFADDAEDEARRARAAAEAETEAETEPHTGTETGAETGVETGIGAVARTEAETQRASDTTTRTGEPGPAASVPPPAIDARLVERLREVPRERLAGQAVALRPLVSRLQSLAARMSDARAAGPGD